MERYDVYDLDRRLTGETLVRGEPHADTDCQLVIHACLFNRKGELLIQQRDRSKRSYPEYWDFSVGGGVLAGETPRQAAVREVKEELGLEIPLPGAAAVTLSFPGGFDDYYIVDCDVPIEAVTLQKGEVQDARWATKEEILQMLERGAFAPFWPSFIELIFDLHAHLGLSE